MNTTPRLSSTRTFLAAIILTSSTLIACSSIEAPRGADPDENDADIIDHDTDTNVHDTKCSSNTDCIDTDTFCSEDQTCQPYPKLALGDTHSCAIIANGDVMCWGDNSYAQLGTKTTETPIPCPTTIKLD